LSSFQGIDARVVLDLVPLRCRDIGIIRKGAGAEYISEANVIAANGDGDKLGIVGDVGCLW
jgi:hypothetical protein